jgi:hypothetical protein
MLEGELESEFEQEMQEGEGEGILGTIGNVLGGLLNEGEGEMELHEFHENGHRELHEGEHQELHESGLHELEGEFELEGESGEQFFGKIFRGVGNLVRRAAPILRQVARVAAPMVATAIGGPLGGLVGKAAGSLLGEGEAEMELHELGTQEGEFEAQELHEVGLHEMHELGMHELEGEMQELHEGEFEMHEASHEAAHEIASHELTQHEALAEMMAQHAAFEQHEAQAEAMVGAAVVTTLSPRDRRELRRILPHLVRGVAILTRVLRRRRITRPAVRAVPTVVRRTVQVLRNQAANGRPITRATAARAAATQVRRVIGNPTACAAAISQNIRANRALRRSRPIAG